MLMLALSCFQFEEEYNMTNAYDLLIKKSAAIYLPDMDWRLLKAQLIAESNLDPNAVSPVGATGIAQFIGATWSQISHELNYPLVATPLDPEYAIPAAAYYMSKLWNKWTSPRPDIDRYCLALASYNAGMRNILKAQRSAGGVNDYKTIIASLHKVTGRHSQETTNYVKRVLRLYQSLVTG